MVLLGFPCCFFQLVILGAGAGGLVAALSPLKEAIFVAHVLETILWTAALLSWE